MSEPEWLRPLKIIENYAPDTAFEDAVKELYLAVIHGDVRVRFNGRVWPEWIKQINRMKISDDGPFALPPDIELSVEDVRRLWPPPSREAEIAS
jgi:hypothetical protein